MAERYFADHVTTETLEEVRIEINDSEFSGTATKLKGTGSGWASRSVQQLDVREPLSNPIQKSEVSATLWLKSSSLIDDLFSSEEGRFTLKYEKESTEYFEGTILPDLCDYEYLEDDALWKLTVKAKDLSGLSGEDYSMTSGRVTIIEAIADILPFSKTIKTHTSWIVDGETAANDYLRQVYLDKFALRTYARTGDESDEPITKLEALEWILKSNGLILKQENGWVLDHITAMSNPASVLETNYDSAGAFVSASNVDLTNTAKIVLQSKYNHNPGIKTARLKYDHRTAVSGIQFPADVILDATTGNTEEFSQLFQSDGNQEIDFFAEVNARWDTGVTEGSVRYEIEVGGEWWDDTNKTFSATQVINEKELTLLDQTGTFTDSLALIRVSIASIPDSLDGTLDITIYRAQGDDTNQQTLWRRMSLNIINAVADENTTYIDYKLTQTGDQSVRVKYGSVYFGDGPTGYSRSALTTDSAGTSFTTDDWARRGESSFVNHAEVLLREVLDVQRKSRTRISATVKSTLSFGDVISYGGNNYYVLGGSFDGYTGVSSVELLEIDIQTDLDTFEKILKFTDDEATGTSSSQPSSGGGITSLSDLGVSASSSELNILDGATLSTAELNILDGVTATATELNRLDGSLSTVQGNLGLKDGSADLDLNSLTLTDLGTSGAILFSNASGKITETSGLIWDGVSFDVGADLVVETGNTFSIGASTVDETELGILEGATLTTAELNQLDGNVFTSGMTGTSADFSGAVEVNSLDIGTTGHGFDSSGNVSARTIKSYSNIYLESANTDIKLLETGVSTDEGGWRINTFSGTLLFRTIDDSLTNGDTWLQVTRSGTDVNKLIIPKGTIDVVTGDYQIATTTVIDSSRNAFFEEGTFGGDLTAGANLLYQGNIESDNFADASGLYTGFQLGQDEFKAELIRANELRVKAFVAEVSSALYGEDILTKSRGVLSRDFEVPSTTGTLYVEDLEGLPDTAVFESGDWVRLTFIDRSGGGLVTGSVWGNVTNYTNLSGGEQSWTFTRDSGTSGNTIYAGSVAIDYGTSGDSVIVRSVIGSNTPRDTQLTWATDPSDAGNYTIVTRTGILDDIDDISGSGFYSANAYFTDSLLVGSLDKSGSYFEVDGTDINAVGLNLDVTSLPRVSDLGLRGLFRMDGDTLDAETGTEMSTTDVTFASGQSRESAVFNGTTSFATFDLFSVITVSSDYGVGFWLFTASDTTSVQTIWENSAGSLDRNGCGIVDGQLQFRIYDGSYTIKAADISTNTWYYVFCSHDGSGNIDLFLNAESKDDTVGSFFGLHDGSTDFQLGRRTNSTQFLEARIDELRIYTIDKEVSEIKSLYANPSGNSGGLISTDNLVVGSTALINDLMAQTITFSGSLANSADTLFIDDSKLVLGTDASTQTLGGASDEGVYANTSGHFRAGRVNAFGNVPAKGIMWNGTNLLLEANNLSITSSGATFSGELSAVTGSFGDVDISGVLTMGGSGEITNSGDTLFIDDSTFVLGTDADGQVLKGSFDAGVYANTSGHFRAGSMGSTTLNKGILWDGTDFEMSDANIIGTLEMGTNGEITNSGGDYSITSGGIFIESTSSYVQASSLRFGDDVRLYGGTNSLAVETQNGRDVVLSANGTGADIDMFASNSINIGYPNRNLSFFNVTPVGKQSIDESTTNTAITEIQDILIAYGLGEDNR